MNILSALFTLVLLVTAFSSSIGSGWSYGDYTVWPGICQTGGAQSPIDLAASSATERVYSAFNFINYDQSYSGKVTNNGHSIAIYLFPNNESVPMINGGGLPNNYILDHIHFHWQSEHTVEGFRYPLEMHLVHYSTKFSSLSEAAENAGIAVLGILFEMSLDSDEDFIPLIEVMDKVEKQPSQEALLERTISPKSFVPRNSADYYRYQGSLTTPNCNEGVTWTVFLNPLPISADQISHFEDTWSEEGPLTLNFRPVQPLNGRAVNLRRSPARRRSPPSSSTNLNSSLVLVVLFSAIAKYVF